MSDVICHAGVIDPTRLTDQHRAAQRIQGRFVAKPNGVQSFPWRSLQTLPTRPPPCTGLKLDFLTMLRLNDGEGLQQARLSLQNGAMCVPRLNLLASKVLDRCQALGLSPADSWLLPELRDTVALLDAQADEIHVQRASLYPYNISRFSARAERRDPLGGLIGQAVYEAPPELISRAFPLFKLAEWTRIGRKTGLGAGRVQATLLP
jgi:hypothetical protein